MRGALAAEALAPFENLSFHYVAPATRADGTSVILKTCAFSDEFEHGLAALRLFDGRGSARLLEFDEEQNDKLSRNPPAGILRCADILARLKA